MTKLIFFRKILKFILKITGLLYLEKIIYNVVAFPFQFTNYYILWTMDTGIGDHLCMTAVIRKIKYEINKKIIVLTFYPEFFLDNEDVYKVVNIKKDNLLFKRFFEKINIKNIGRFASPNGVAEYMLATNSRESLISVHSKGLKLDIDATNMKPILFFNSCKIIRYKQKYMTYAVDKFAIITPNSKISYTPNKSYPFDRFQKVVDEITDYTWVQVGAKNEKLLNNVIDMRGCFEDFKELAYFIGLSEFILSTEGLFNHLASTTNTKSFVIFSGFHHVEIALYENTIPIVLTPQEPCSPCWLSSPCPYVGKPCTDKITSEQIIKTIRLNMG